MGKYDFLIVGAGLFGSTFAQQAAERGKRCLVIERRSHLAGIAHCDVIGGIPAYRYGPHVFHTRDREVWDYVNRFSRFNHYIHAPVALRSGEAFPLPFNMHTFSRIWHVQTPAQARELLDLERDLADLPEGNAKNLEDVCVKLLGQTLYEKFFKHYIEKQSGQPCTALPPVTGGLPSLRYSYDCRYYEDPYQGIPTEGYDVMVKRMLAGCDVMLETEYLGFGRANAGIADKTIYTGMIDEFFRFKRGTLVYRTVRYETETMNIPDYQGCAVIDHMDPDDPCLRVIEHKHFLFGKQPLTVITREYPAPWSGAMEPYFPVADEENQKLYQSYRALAVTQPDVIFCGRLGSYHFYHMDETIRAAMDLVNQLVPVRE